MDGMLFSYSRYFCLVLLFGVLWYFNEYSNMLLEELLKGTYLPLWPWTVQILPSTIGYAVIVACRILISRESGALVRTF